MNKKILKLLPAVTALFIAKPVLAVCPVCTVAVGAGLGLSRWLGIDDTVSGVWIGGLIVSLIGWNLSWYEKKGWKNTALNILTAAAWYAVTILPLYFGGIIGHPDNTLWGIDKLIIGILTGSVIFVTASKIHGILKKTQCK